MTSQNKEEICHVLPSDVQQNEKTLEIYSSEYTISSKRYNEIAEEEIKVSFPHEYQFVEEYTKPNQQEVIVHSIHSTTITSSSQLSPGRCYLLFEVIHAEDPSLIGCHVSCRILERRKSNISGSEGRLAILPLYIKTPSGNRNVRPVPIMRRGKNISNVKFCTFPLVVPIFIPGTGAKILPRELFTLLLNDFIQHGFMKKQTFFLS